MANRPDPRFVLLVLAMLVGQSTVVARAAAPATDDSPAVAKPAETQPVPAKRKPVLLPAAQRRNRSGTPPPLLRERRTRPRYERRIVPTPLPPARGVRGDRGPPLGVPDPHDPRFISATPPLGVPPLPPARQVPGETGIPLGPGPLSPVR